MDISKISMAMSQSTLVSSIQLSVIKIQMNIEEEMVIGINETLQNMAVDISKGINLDLIA